jgi:release factor glutamine methyltransferase
MLKSIVEMNLTLLQTIRQSCVTQPDKPEETPESTLRALYFLAAGIRVSVTRANALRLPELKQEEYKRLASLVEQRCSGIPLAHLTNRQSFMGIEMLAGPQALIPRAETQLLAYETLSIAKSMADSSKPVTLIDICTGSGNIVLGVLAHEPRCQAFGSDLSPEAIELARDNAIHLGVDQKVEFKVGDLFEPFYADGFLGKADIITCNPPYISSKKVSCLPSEISCHEPHLAFDGGPYGLNILRRIINEAPKFLKPKSYLCLEVGCGQGEIVSRMLKNSNQYHQIDALVDEKSVVRAFKACT